MSELEREIPRSAIEGVVYIVERQERFLIARRIKEGSDFYGEFLFPGGLIEAADIDIFAAVKREFKEEREADLKTPEYLGPVSYLHPNGSLITEHIFLVRERDFVGEVGNTEPEKEELHWITIDEAESLCTTNAAREVLGKLKDYKNSIY